MGGSANETRRVGRDSGWRAVGLLLLLLAAGLLLAACAPAASQTAAPVEGTPAVRTKLEASDPAQFTLTAGKPQLVEFFAFW